MLKIVFRKSVNNKLSGLCFISHFSDLEDDAVDYDKDQCDGHLLDDTEESTEITETDSHGIPTDHSKINKVVEPPPVQGRTTV